MPRFVSVKDGRITTISNHFFHHQDAKVIAIPETMNNISNEEILLHYTVKNDCLSHRHQYKPANELKVAFIGNYREACGLSTYNENLFPAIAKHLVSFKLFIEHNDFPTGDILQFAEQTLLPDQVSVCWKRSQPLSQLVQAIKQYDPDIILISHEWGLFPNARHWLSFLSQLSNYRIITILHSVFPTHLDKSICETAIPEIIVHQEAAKTALQHEKQITKPIYVIPHGCYKASNPTKLWDLYNSKQTFIQLGFGFRYKRFDLSLQAVKLLKAKYPDVFFTALISESPFNKIGHQLYYEELLKLAEQLDIQDNVALLRGFQSDGVIDSYLRTNRAAVFPYASEPGHQVFGSSGAARMAMSKGIPVISSSIPHFQDLPTIKANTPEEIATALEQLFEQPKAQQEQIERQLSFIEENSWSKVAKKIIDIFEGSVIL